MIFLRDQPIEPARFLAFARAFGDPVEYPFVKGLDAFPQIIEVAKLEGETTNFGGIWHSDTVYLDEPPMGSMLLAREIHPQGGDTCSPTSIWPTRRSVRPSRVCWTG